MVLRKRASKYFVSKSSTTLSRLDFLLWLLFSGRRETETFFGKHFPFTRCETLLSGISCNVKVSRSSLSELWFVFFTSYRKIQRHLELSQLYIVRWWDLCLLHIEDSSWLSADKNKHWRAPHTGSNYCFGDKPAFSLVFRKKICPVFGYLIYWQSSEHTFFFLWSCLNQWHQL